MTTREEAMLAHMNKYSNTGRFVDTEELYQDVFCKHDAENDLIVVEFKYRAKHFDTLMLEKPKFDYLIEQHEKTGKKPIYVCRTPKGLYIFELLKLKDIKWCTNNRNPATTSFGNTNKVDKTFTDLDVSLAFKDPRWSEVF